MAKNRTEVADIDRSLYDFTYGEEGFERLAAGITPDIVREISSKKNEPEWMLELRLKSLDIFNRFPNPTWGPGIDGLDMDNIVTYVKPNTDQKHDWDSVPDDIKNTFERLGIPEAERSYLAGVGAQYDSELVYHNMQDTASKMGIVYSGIEEALHGVEWTTLCFFAGLFIIVGAMSETGVIGMLAQGLIDVTGGNLMITMLAVLFGSAVISSFLDNIPFVATMIPIILTLEADGLDGTALWWALSLGACLGGNGTLIGASANVVLSDISKKFGHEITFMQFFKRGFPIMLFTVAIAAIYMVIRFPGG